MLMVGLPAIHGYGGVLIASIALLLALCLVIQCSLDVGAQSPAMRVDWVALSNPTRELDHATAVCEAGDLIYVVGVQGLAFDSRGAYLRVEMRFKSNGSIAGYWSPGFDPLADCVIVGDRLYAVSWSFAHGIMVSDLSLSSPMIVVPRGYRPEFGGGLTAITSHGNHLYVAGFERVGEAYRWIVLKLDAGNLAFVKKYTSNATSRSEVYSIAVNPVTRHLWVIGGQFFPLYFAGGFRIEMLDLDLNLMRVISRDDRSTALTIGFDENGYAYLGGVRLVSEYNMSGFIARYDMNGNEVALKEMPGRMIYKLLYSNGYLYVTTIEYHLEGRTGMPRSKLLLEVFDKNLNDIHRMVLDEDATIFPIPFGKMAFDGRSLYVPGGKIVESEGGWEGLWAVYSISISPPELGTTTEAYARVESPFVKTQHTITPIALLIAVVLVAIVVAWMLIAKRK